MNSRNILIISGVIVLFCIMVSVYYNRSAIPVRTNAFYVNYSDNHCDFSNGKYIFCCVNSDNNYSFDECDPGAVSCNQLVYYAVNLTKFELPEEYRTCFDTIQLSNPFLPKTLNLMEYDYDANRVFLCPPMVFNRSSEAVFYEDGQLPNNTQPFSTVVYVFPANQSWTNINDIFNARNNATVLISFQGEIRC